MGLFKRATDAAADAAPSGPPTREEFEALRRELAALKRVTAIAIMAVEECAKHSNVHGGPASPSIRLQKIAHAAELFKLDDVEQQMLRDVLALRADASSVEFDRERQETIDNAYAPAWRADGTYGRRIPGSSR